MRRLLLDLAAAWTTAFRRLRERDLALLAAGVTCYAAVAVVPGLLVALRAGAALVGEDAVRSLADDLASALPSDLGAPAVAAVLVERGASLSLKSTAIAVLPATLYGEGLRRAFLALRGRRERLTGWRGRVGALAGLVAAPVPVLCVLLLTPWLAGTQAADGGMTVLGLYVAFLVDWLILSAALVYVYGVVAPVRPPRRALVLGALSTGSVVAGFVLGFVLFLSLPLDLGAPFGGFAEVGAAVAVLLWLWLLHALVLAGYEVTIALAAAPGRDREQAVLTVVDRSGRTVRRSA